ncbi:WXG100 family type VII secretion target [Nocardia sp. NPDC051052]|uniref:WXG100 family type VII secretion target n=1 Tax=Nocardia sp. NPDC051052 TaxID=3364322 RepID=UPI00378F1A0E
MTIMYDPKTMNQLYDELKNHGGKMQQEITTLETVAKAFHNNLAGKNASASFDAMHKELDTELTDTIDKVNQLAAQVESALNRALEADNKVGDGFSAYA